VQNGPVRRTTDHCGGTRKAAPAAGAGLLALLILLAVLGASSTRESAQAAPSPGSGPGSSATTVGLIGRTVRVDGVVREFLLSLPAHRSGPSPLVVAFHGLGQHAAAFAAGTGLVPATRAAGEVLALPESRGPAFNDGRLGPHGPRDDAFTVALIDQLVRAGLVDPHRVVVAGFSNGAGMAMEVADRHPAAIAAFVSIAGDMIAGPGAPRPTGPVRACLVHGTADPVQPWNGRPARGVRLPAYIPVLASVDEWVHADRAGPVSTRTLAGQDGQGTVIVHAWQPGPSGAGVTFYEVGGMGHSWPLGGSSADHPNGYAIDATALVVQTAAATVSPPTSAAGG
jgi:poly(3-hydroxybutyrate) depolymerase